MGAWDDVGRDFLQVKGRGSAVALGQDEAGADASRGTDGAEDVGRAGPLIVRRRWPCPPLGPAARDLVLLTDPGLVLPPDLYRGALWQGPADRCHLVGEIFLNAAAASGSCA